jgi:TRAP-type uncharacterized transport system substrate-binding protein
MPGQTAAVRTWASAALLMARRDVPEELVHALTRTMVEGREQLIAVDPITAYLTAEEALDSQVGDVHPGAARLDREVGVLS